VNAVEHKTAQPGDYYLLELVASTIGVAASGIGIGLVGAALTADPNPSKYCSTICLNFGSTIEGFKNGALIGMPLGAAVGILITGSLLKIEGNFFGAILGAALFEVGGVSLVSNLPSRGNVYPWVGLCWYSRIYINWSCNWL
jgi:hypothetical protein